MNMTTTLDEEQLDEVGNPGEQLAKIRKEKGYTVEYVANKLHLRSCIIEFIEGNKFHLLPEPVFVKGYLRAYAKLLGIAPEPYLAVFNERYYTEKKTDRVFLRLQNNREPQKAEYFIRWFTLLFALGVVVAVGMWWQKSKEDQQLFTATSTPAELSLDESTPNMETTEIKLTDISKMQSLLNPKPEMSALEKPVE